MGSPFGRTVRLFAVLSMALVGESKSSGGLAAVCALSPQSKVADQPTITITKVEGSVPAKDARIVKYYVDEAASQSGYETGGLHIIYSDQTEVVENLPPKKTSPPNEVVFNEEGITSPKMAADMRTIGWTEQFDNCCTSYSIPLVLAIYGSGRNIVEIQQGQMIWNWMFLNGGKRVAAVWGPVHFSDIGDYQLYDTKTGQKIDEVLANAEIEGKSGTIHGLGPDAPAWAKELEKAAIPTSQINDEAPIDADTSFAVLSTSGERHAQREPRALTQERLVGCRGGTF